ncbi:MAG: ammonia-forming cytochrome c nitrite reductase subunit c552 [Candidatus Poribacteria bacterium]|nr:ammonia-forming cytochrome c nitrite reductase subunit c552 [Candidatus Poribacteria bacterium]
MNENPTSDSGRTWIGWALFAIGLIAVFGLGIMFASIMDRRGESRDSYAATQRVEIDALEIDPSKWATNWPREYGSYREMTDDTTHTKYGGAFPRDYLEETPANVVLFAGYGFSKEYRQARGHVYTVEDVTTTKRNSSTTPATCWTCKSGIVVVKMAEYGRKRMPDAERASLQEAALAGAGDFYANKFDDFRGKIDHPIGCLDCHDPGTMTLRIARPAIVEAFQRQGKDINDVSHQEMRTLVCAQCHVEYYFKGEGKYLTFPWDEGTTPEAMESYYDKFDFADWTHAISKTPMLKMQHPDYEVYTTGIHAYRNVACADCHMPYKTECGVKYSDHHLQSPLLNIENSCQVCHRWGEDEIRLRVEGIQDKVREGRSRAERAVALAHFDIAACIEIGASGAELEPLRKLVRQAQMRWDYVAANNGMGFHSPAECLRILNASVELAQECRIESARVLAAHGYAKPVRYPEFGSKEAAQTMIAQFVNDSPPSLLAR